MGTTNFVTASVKENDGNRYVMTTESGKLFKCVGSDTVSSGSGEIAVRPEISVSVLHQKPVTMYLMQR